jgi:hypothetical protein
MHASFHVAFVPIPHSGRHLIFQTLKGAVDLIPEELAATLRQFDGGSAASLSEQEVDTLTRRGYLTDETPEQEQAQAETVLRLAAKNLRSVVEIAFRFSAGGPPESEGPADPEAIDEVFLLGASAAKRDQLISVAIEIAAPEIAPRLVERILGHSAERDYPIVPVVTPQGLGALSPWRQSQNFQFVILETDASNMPVEAAELAESIVSYFERQIHVGWRCDVDGLSPDQVAAIDAVRRQVREKYPSFMVWPVSPATDGTAEAGHLADHGSHIPYISADNESVLRTLFRFLTTPRQVNYTPFFQPETARLVFTVAANQLSYDSPAVGAVDGFAAVRAAIEAEDPPPPAGFWPPRAGAAECLSCRYSLVCGRDWIKAYGYPTATECAGRFERRLQQVLPLLLFNARGNLRPPAATAKNA